MRWGMVIDLDRCTRCQACVVACQSENNSPYATAQENAKGVTMAWNEVLTESSGKSARGKRWPIGRRGRGG